MNVYTRDNSNRGYKIQDHFIAEKYHKPVESWQLSRLVIADTAGDICKQYFCQVASRPCLFNIDSFVYHMYHFMTLFYLTVEKVVMGFESAFLLRSIVFSLKVV